MTEPSLPASKRLSTGVPGLDAVLRGGLQQGGAYIINGEPGAGKTILASQICFNHVAAGGRVVYLTLLAELHTRMLMHLQSLTFFDPAPVGDALYYVNGFHDLEQGGTAGLLDVVRRVIRDRQASLLVIDGLAAIRLAAQSALAFERFVQQLHGLIDLVGGTVLLLNGNPNVLPYSEQTTVDGVIELRDHHVGLRAVRELEVRKLRGTGYLRGAHHFRITDAGIIVHPRTELVRAASDAAGQREPGRMSDGVPALDAMLHGGFVDGSTTMVFGPSGSGKTILGLHFLAEGVRLSQPSLHFGFYETPPRLMAKAAHIGLDLAGANSGTAIELLWQPPWENLLDALGERLLEAVQRRQVRRLFIDGLKGFQAAAVPAERLSTFFPALAQELRHRDVTTIVSVETRNGMGAEIEAPLNDLSAAVENILRLQYLQVRSRLYRFASITKLRDSDFDSTVHEFTIGTQGIEVAGSAKSAEAILAGSSAPRTRRSQDNMAGRPARRRGGR